MMRLLKKKQATLFREALRLILQMTKTQKILHLKNPKRLKQRNFPRMKANQQTKPITVKTLDSLLIFLKSTSTCTACAGTFCIWQKLCF